MNNKNKKQKFAIIGTSSAGKTTITFQIVGKLKELGVLVDGVFQQDRRIAFDRDKLETEKEAQYWVIFNQLIKECELILKDGTDILVSDRSIVDFYAYYETMYGRDETLFNFVKYWATTYDKLYFLDKLSYQDDGSRPSEEFRDKVEDTLRKIIKEIPNCYCIARQDIYQDILQSIDRVLTTTELDLIPGILGQDILIGGSYAFNRQTKYSDIDIYVVGDSFINSIPELEQRLSNTFGARFEVRQVTPEVAEYLTNEGFITLYYAA